MKKRNTLTTNLFRFAFQILFCGLTALSIAAQTINVPKPSQGKTRPSANSPRPRADSAVQPTSTETKLKAVKTLLPPTGSSNVQTGESIVLDIKNLKTSKGYLILKDLSMLYPNFAGMNGTLNHPGRIIVNLEKIPKGKYLLIFDVEFSSGSGTFFLIKDGGVYDEVNYSSGKQKLFFVVDAGGMFDIFKLEAEFNFNFYSVEAVQLKQ